MGTAVAALVEILVFKALRPLATLPYCVREFMGGRAFRCRDSHNRRALHTRVALLRRGRVGGRRMDTRGLRVGLGAARVEGRRAAAATGLYLEAGAHGW